MSFARAIAARGAEVSVMGFSTAGILDHLRCRFDHECLKEGKCVGLDGYR
jgi:hypothetical protein